MALDSFSAHYCAPRSAAVSLHCRAAIEQGRDLSMQWLQLQVDTMALVSSLSYIIGIDCRPPSSQGQDTSLGKHWGYNSYCHHCHCNAMSPSIVSF